MSKKSLFWMLVMIVISGNVWAGVTATDVQCNPLGCVNTTDLAASAVETAKIADLNITEGKIATGAVTNGKLADLSITDAKIADAAVTTSKIADGAVNDAKIIGPISPNKMGVIQTAMIANRYAQPLENGLSPIVLNEVKYDSGGLVVVDPLNGNMSIKIKEPGIYAVYVWVQFSSIPVGNQAGFVIKVNGSQWDYFYQNGVGGGLPTPLYTTTFDSFNVDDELTLHGYQNTGGPATINGWAQFGVAKISNKP